MKKIISVFISLVLSVFMALPAFAATNVEESGAVASFIFAPVTPGSVPFNYNLTPGSKISDALRMYNNTSSEMTFRLEVAPVPGSTEAVDWLTLSTNTVTVPANSFQDVGYTVMVAETDALGTKHEASLTAIAQGSGEASEGGEDEVGAQLSATVAYGVTVKVNVYNGEPMVSDEADDASGMYAFLKDNLNTILLVVVILIMLKVAMDVARKRK